MNAAANFVKSLALVVLLVPVTVGAQSAAVLPGGREARLEALAIVQTLNARLLASRSATTTLEQWCAEHRMAESPRVIAVVDRGAFVAPSAEQRERLAVGPDEPIGYRRVRLMCGPHLFSEAENWFVPGRLTNAMNGLLEGGDTPFGKVVAPLEPSRRTFAVERLWSPLPDGWDMAVASEAERCPMEIATALFRHRALVLDSEDRPIAEVSETYGRGVLAFAAPWTQRDASHDEGDSLPDC